MRFNLNLHALALRALALGAICVGLAASPAYAIVVPWSGAGDNGALVADLDDQPFLASPALGDTWQIVNFNLIWQTELNSGATPSLFNQTGFSNSNGTFATLFQYTINSGAPGIAGGSLVDLTTGKTWNSFITLAN
jgi:hypothetical protein